MTFRARLLVTFLAAVLIPIVALALVVRHEMTHRLTAQYERRVESLVGVIEEDLAQEDEAIRAALAGLCNAVADDNRFRRAALDGTPDERRYVLDYAAGAMRVAGLDVLQIQDDTGRIVSSGHFRNEYDRVEPELPRLLAAATGAAALIGARAPDGRFLALARVDSVTMGGRRFDVVGGVRVEGRFLERLASADDVTVTVLTPGERDAAPAGAPAGTGRRVVERELDVPFVDAAGGRLGEATFRVTHDLAELDALRRNVDRWFLVAVAATAILAAALATSVASRVSRPLVELSEKTARVDLDRLDVDFDTSRNDEIGSLARVLGAMTARLRESAAQVKDAERRATLGELARQVNHDIRNGLTPLRNVFRHLAEVARDEPQRLEGVFEERRGTLDSSISYLETLASNYARFARFGRASAPGERRACDVNEIVRRVVADRHRPGQAADLRFALCERAVVLGDPVSLRRIFENLVDNAVDSLESRPGRVEVSTSAGPGEDGRPLVRITVLDTGVGMSEGEQGRAFDDFYTTKPGGTGLGLSIVRRLVMDHDGAIRVESAPGAGSRFVVELPGAGAA